MRDYIEGRSAASIPLPENPSARKALSGEPWTIHLWEPVENDKGKNDDRDFRMFLIVEYWTAFKDQDGRQLFTKADIYRCISTAIGLGNESNYHTTIKKAVSRVGTRMPRKFPY